MTRSDATRTPAQIPLSVLEYFIRILDTSQEFHSGSRCRTSPPDGLGDRVDEPRRSAAALVEPPEGAGLPPKPGKQPGEFTPPGPNGVDRQAVEQLREVVFEPTVVLHDPREDACAHERL